jgi:hypothetical protein
MQEIKKKELPVRAKWPKFYPGSVAEICAFFKRKGNADKKRKKEEPPCILPLLPAANQKVSKPSGCPPIWCLLYRIGQGYFYCGNYVFFTFLSFFCTFFRKNRYQHLFLH